MTTFMSCSISRIVEVELVAQLAHEVGQPRRLVGVHARRRLVEEQELGLGGQRAGDLHPALVAVGQRDRRGRRRCSRAARRSSSILRAFSRTSASSRRTRGRRGGSSRPDRPSCARAGRASRSRSRSSSPNRRMFWNVRAMPAARDPVRADPGDVPAVEADLARARLVKPGEHVEERRLAGAVGPDDRDDALARHAEGDVVDRDQAAEDLRDVPGVEQQVRAVARGRLGRLRGRLRPGGRSARPCWPARPASAPRARGRPSLMAR